MKQIVNFLKSIFQLEVKIVTEIERKEYEVIIPINPIYESKRENRFIVKFPLEFEIPEWSVIDISYPSFYNEWDDIKISFIDIIGSGSTSNALYDLIKKFEGKSNVELFTFTINSLDPTGVIIDEWEIKVKEILNVNFGIGDCRSYENRSTSLIIKPLDCILKF